MSSSYEEMMASKNFLPFHLDHLTPRMMQMAKEELNEDENTRSSSIEQLRKLIAKENNLSCRTDDEHLLQFLRARKFDVKKAFARLKAFYTVVSKTYPEVYNNIDEETTKKAFTRGFACNIPYRDRDGASVMFFKMSNWKTEDLDVLSILNCTSAVALSALDVPATQVCGLQTLTDARGTTLKHMLSLTPRYLYLLSKCLRDTFPVRVTGVHLINASRIFRYLWNIIHFFLSEKIRNRVHFHDGNLENLHKFIPKEILPIEYGGDNPNFDPVELGSAELEKFLPKYLRLIRDGYKEN